MNHEDVLKKLGDIYTKKNNDYGNSFAKSYDEFGMTSGIIRLSDKLERLKSLQKNEQLVSDESLEDTLLDLANYAIMIILEENKKRDVHVYDISGGTMNLLN